jgi:hypothetical protein
MVPVKPEEGIVLAGPRMRGGLRVRQLLVELDGVSDTVLRATWKSLSVAERQYLGETSFKDVSVPEIRECLRSYLMEATQK